MDYRGVLVFALVGGAFAASMSCSAADPSTVNFEGRPENQTITEDSGADSSGTSGSSTSGDGGGSSSSGDGGTEGGGAINAFTGATAFDATSAAMVMKMSEDPNATHMGFNAQANPVGMDCMAACHKTGGPATAWAFAGSVYTDNTGGTAFTTFAEVRITDTTGKLVGSAYVDGVGNVWADATNITIPAGAHVGVRDGTRTQLMTQVLSGPADGACNSACHKAGGAAGGTVFLK